MCVQDIEKELFVQYAGTKDVMSIDLSLTLTILHCLSHSMSLHVHVSIYSFVESERL